jgi:hypothetical protein
LTISGAGLDKQGFAIPLGLIFLGLITALGCAVEGFAQFTLAKLIQASVKHPKIAEAFCKGEEVARVRDWQQDFEEALRRAMDFPDTSQALRNQAKSFAGGIFHKTVSPDQVKYVDTHYNVFMLSSGLAILAFFSPLPTAMALIEVGSSTALLSLAIFLCLAAAYSLSSLALGNYLFVWEASFRYGCLLLWEKPKKSAVQPKFPNKYPHDLGVPPDD